MHFFLRIFSALCALGFCVGFHIPSSFPTRKQNFAVSSQLSRSTHVVFQSESAAEDSVVSEDEDFDFGFDMVEEDARVVTLSANALKHLAELKEKQGKADAQLHLRMGVKSGGCSGMSYVMDFMEAEDVADDDHIELWEEQGLKCAIDPKSLLYLYGLELDYSDELIGGGFEFRNPNAEQTCGCGKSFGV
ncbi:unnamed protein product [Heterosigma akashiwo]|mmetsp:Transcript_18958/g.33045  ORF Transcript_18958/g.33045 Transcript_18958/m.33045 type:complete len:190 (-) Transcript_18958:96-665(-)